MKLLDETFADGQFGKYVRRTGLKVDITPTGIQQNYSFQEIVQGLKQYEINSKSYIYSGLLRTVEQIPVYGVAIGKGVVTFAEDGTETYVDENKVAELTADELSFWQDDEKIASYKGDRISFFFDEEEIFYIAEGKVYCAGDMEITAGGSLKIKTGGTFTLESGQFTVDAAGNATFAGKLRADCIEGGTLTLGGDNNKNGQLVIKDENGDTIGSWDKDGISAEKGTFKGTIQSGSVIAADISANNIKGGKLSLGGLDNASGTLEVKDANGAVIGKWDKDGITAEKGTFKGTIQSGSVIAADISANNIKGGKLSLGGNANASGTLEVKDANGTVIGKWDKDGISATSGSFSGDITGASGTFSGSIQGATGQFAGTMKTGDWTLDTNGLRYSPMAGLEFAITQDGSISGDYGIDFDPNSGAIYLYYGGYYITFDLLREELSLPGDLLADDLMPGYHGTHHYIGSSTNKWDDAYIVDVHQGSSRAIKQDIEALGDEGDIIDKLLPVSFRYKDDEKKRKRFGLIWEDTVEVLPEICHQDPEAEDPDRGKTITYMDLIPIMLKEIQDPRARVAELERRL
jgi:hypothetical protein